MSLEAVVFDLYGTLVESLPHDVQHGLELARAVSAPPEKFASLWRESVYDRMAGKFASMEETVAHICAKLGISPSPMELQEAAVVRARALKSFIAVRPDAAETLLALKKAGLRTGLITNSGPGTAEAWQQTPLAGLIDEAVFSYEVRMTKPDPAIFRLACERLMVRPDACMYVGDGGDDELSGAESVGMRAVLLRMDGDHADEPYRREAVEWQGASVKALAELLPLCGPPCRPK